MNLQSVRGAARTRGAGDALAQRGARRQSQLAIAWQSLRRDKAALFGAIIVLLAVLVAVIGPSIAPHDPTEQRAALRMAKPFTSEFLLGGDFLGRDILSRLLYGARATVSTAVLATALGTFAGAVVGTLSAFVGGRADEAIMRTVDAVLSVPSLLFALLIVNLLGKSGFNALLAVGITWLGPPR